MDQQKDCGVHRRGGAHSNRFYLSESYGQQSASDDSRWCSYGQWDSFSKFLSPSLLLSLLKLMILAHKFMMQTCFLVQKVVLNSIHSGPLLMWSYSHPSVAGSRWGSRSLCRQNVEIINLRDRGQEIGTRKVTRDSRRNCFNIHTGGIHLGDNVG